MALTPVASNELCELLERTKIVVVLPAYNEERNIGAVIETMPEFVDRIVIVDDGSADGTAAVVERHIEQDHRVLLTRHEQNLGAGAAAATGFKWARDNGMDIAVLMAGDGQTSVDDLPHLLGPVVSGHVDYAKGNRLVYANAKFLIPKVRLVGNVVLSFLTKIASGYWRIADSQSGYIAMNRMVLQIIDWEQLYERYGWPNDLLVRLNIHQFRVGDVPIQPLYGVGESSSMRIPSTAWQIALMLIRLFVWRMVQKYIVRDFHPLVLFYFLSFLFFCSSAVFLIRVVVLWSREGFLPELSTLALLFSVGTSLQTAFFAMWMDMDYNRTLNITISRGVEQDGP